MIPDGKMRSQYKSLTIYGVVPIVETLGKIFEDRVY